MDVRARNRVAWDRLVGKQDRWTVPVSSDTIARARRGELQLLLTPSRPVPHDWYPVLRGLKTLCLASGGGQQGPLLAAAGAVVTVFDNSPRQLAQDRFVADRDGLQIETIDGDMADLSVFADDTFGLIFHPVSNCFSQVVRPVWRECFRVLRPGGVLLAGFTNPVRYLFDVTELDRGNFSVRYPIPYSDCQEPRDPERQRLIREEQDTYEFGHTLDDQIGGQLDVGFVITGFFEDRYHEAVGDPISRYLPTFIATRAVKRR
ncbi:MAG: class I SAM-dependent methyltransferase [Pirellulales bacterium]